MLKVFTSYSDTNIVLILSKQCAKVKYNNLNSCNFVGLFKVPGWLLNFGKQNRSSLEGSNLSFRRSLRVVFILQK